VPADLETAVGAAAAEFLTPTEYGTRIRVSRNTTYELLRRGEIPHVRFGRLIRIPKTALLTCAWRIAQFAGVSEHFSILLGLCGA
jgi:excisionase family DNA binding protein